MPLRPFIALRSRAALLLFLLTAIFGVAADQWSKHLAFKYLSARTITLGGEVGASKTYPLDPSATVTINGTPSTLNMLPVGGRVALKLADDGKSVLTVTAGTETTTGSASATDKTITGLLVDATDAVSFHDGIYHANAKPPLPIISNWLDLQIMANQGAVFGIGQRQRVLFISVSVAAILFIFYLFTVSERQRFYQFILGLLLAGVIGNLYDRVVKQYVRDMIHFHLTSRDLFPYIFNIADSLLCVGVGLMIVHSFLHNPKKQEQAMKQPA